MHLSLQKETYRTYHLQLEGRSYQIKRIEIPFLFTDPFAFFAHQSLYPKFYLHDHWENAFRFGIGALLTTSIPPSFQESVDPLFFYGGMNFSKRAAKTLQWKHFPSSYFFLPKVEGFIQKQTPYLAFNFFETPAFVDPNISLWQNSIFPTPYAIETTPSFSKWQEKLSYILEHIHSGDIEKVVLAYRETHRFKHKIDPKELFVHLCKNKTTSHGFYIEHEKGHVFLGCTPEKLYDRIGENIYTEAIAGTRPRGKTEQQDLLFQKELLESPKEQREFQCVLSFLYEKNKQFCQRLEKQTSQNIIQTETVQHLCHYLKGILKPGITDQQIIHHLHPTPAMCGTPTKAAKEMIYLLEDFDRGWYAAPIGYLSAAKARMVVAIRSALIENHLLHLFAGTGIVDGSQPKKEWKELKQKLSQFQLWKQ